MRTRKEVHADAVESLKHSADRTEAIGHYSRLTLEVLLDIRDLLENPPVEIIGQQIPT
jgi:hypothetical protein